MSFTVDIEIKREFDAECSEEKAFEVLSDVPRSVSHFPKVEKLTDIGDNTFKWEMQKIGTDKIKIQTVYACKYISNKEEGWVKWEPVAGIGNAVIRGDWDIKSQGKKAKINFFTKGELTIPLPAITKFAAGPVVKHEFNSMVDTYIKNLKKTFTDLAK